MRTSEASAIISSYLAGRSVRSIALEYGKTERAVKLAIGRSEYARRELARDVGA